MEELNAILETLLNSFGGDRLEELANIADSIRNIWPESNTLDDDGDNNNNNTALDELQGKYNALRSAYIERFFGREPDPEPVEINNSNEESEAGEETGEEEEKEIVFERTEDKKEEEEEE